MSDRLATRACRINRDRMTAQLRADLHKHPDIIMEQLRLLPPEHRPAAIDATARKFSRQAILIDAAGFGLPLLGWLFVWIALP